jgi:hypothetical protein
MGQMKRILGWAACAMSVFACVLCIQGCSSSPNGGGGDGEEYNLVVVLEKNLDSGQDVIYVRFRRDNAGISGGVVVIDGDTITTSSASGSGSKTYNSARWQHGEKILIAAVDAAESFVYRDSVVMPGAFNIDNVLPANHIWRPVNGNANVSWTTSIGSVNYAVSVRARTTNTTSRGLAEYSESQAGLAHVIPPSTFQEAQSNNPVEDVYDLFVIAYAPNFIERPTGTVYKVPATDDVRSPIQGTNIDGGIAALVVCERDTLQVQTE